MQGIDAALYVAAFDQSHAQALAHDLVTLIDQAMRESDYSRAGARLAGLQFHDFGFRAQRITDEHGLWHQQLVIAKIGDQRAERRVADRQANHQGEGEGAVDEDLAELTRLYRLQIDVQRLRVAARLRWH